MVKSSRFAFLTLVMKGLIGTYDCKADAKGRILLPVALKDQIGQERVFVLKRAVFNSCLEMYPMKQWEKLMGKINKLNRFVKKNNDFIRRFTAGVKIVEVDAVGRLLVPKNLCEVVGIKKEIVLSSSIDIIEVWDKVSYELVIDDSADDFATLAEKVMGDLDDNVS